MKVSAFIATSLDGYIAREDGNLDWLQQEPVEGEDFGFSAFFGSCSTLILGRGTYETVLGFGEWPYGNKRVIVLSSSLTEAPENLTDRVSFYSGELKPLVEELEKEGETRLYVDGGKTIQAFLNEGLLDDITINLIPIIIGSGISLFGPVEKDILLKHRKTVVYDNGFVQMTYGKNHDFSRGQSDMRDE